MTLPTGSLSMSQISTELGLSLPLNIQHAWVRALAQVGGAACDFNSLRGKTGRFDGSVAATSGGGAASIALNAPFFGGTIQSVVTGPSPINETQLIFFSQVQGGLPPNWSGNILVKNNTSGISVVLPKVADRTWQTTFVSGLIRSGFTDNFTILPSN